MQELGSLLRQLREKESLRDVSNRSGISHTYLSIIEKGVDQRTGNPVKPTPDTLKILSKAYNYPYEDLMIKAGYLNESTVNYALNGGVIDDAMSTEHLIELETVLQRADLVFKGKGLKEKDRLRAIEMLTLLFHETRIEEI